MTQYWKYKMSRRPYKGTIKKHFACYVRKKVVNGEAVMYLDVNQFEKLQGRLLSVRLKKSD